MFSKRNHLLYHFSITIHPHLASLYAQNTFKKMARKNADWTKYWIWIEGVWGLWPYMYSYNRETLWLNKISKKNLRVDYYLLPKYCRRQCAFSLWTKSPTIKILHHNARFMNVFWDLIASKRRIEQINFFDWLRNVKNLVLWNRYKLVRSLIQWDLNSFFFPKTQKSPSGWGLFPQTPIDTGGWGLRRPDPCLWNVWVAYTSLLTHASKVRHLHVLTISFCPLPLPESWLSAIRLRLQIFHSTISLPHKSSFFENF